MRNCRHALSFSDIMTSTVATKERTLVIICSTPRWQTGRGWASRSAVVRRVGVHPSPAAQMFVGVAGVRPIRWRRRGADFTAALCISCIRMRRVCLALPLPSPFAVTLNGRSIDIQRLPSNKAQRGHNFRGHSHTAWMSQCQ